MDRLCNELARAHARLWRVLRSSALFAGYVLRLLCAAFFPQYTARATRPQTESGFLTQGARAEGKARLIASLSALSRRSK